MPRLPAQSGKGSADQPGGTELMTACVLLFDHRFQRAHDGTVFSPTSYGHQLLSQRYLGVFEHLTVIARVDESTGDWPTTSAVQGDGVRLVDVGSWHGLRGLFRPA